MSAARGTSPGIGALRPPGRLLAPEELAARAAEIAADPALWRPLASLGAEERKHESLYVDEHLGIWVISWMPGHDTGFHDHDTSCGAVAVAQGQISDERPCWGREPLRIEVRAGESFHFGASEIHRMVNVGDEPAVTIHAYSRPLKRMGGYRVDESGQLHRRSLDWDETLAPE